MALDVLYTDNILSVYMWLKLKVDQFHRATLPARHPIMSFRAQDWYVWRARS